MSESMEEQFSFAEAPEQNSKVSSEYLDHDVDISPEIEERVAQWSQNLLEDMYRRVQESGVNDSNASFGNIDFFC